MNHKEIRKLLKIKTQEVIQQKTQGTQQTNEQINLLLQANQGMDKWSDMIAKWMTIWLWWIIGLTVLSVIMIIIAGCQRQTIHHNAARIEELERTIRTNNATCQNQIESLTASNQDMTSQITMMTTKLNAQNQTINEIIPRLNWLITKHQ